jgi:hypothetical protein
MGKFIFTNGGGLSVASGPSTTSKANSNLTGFLDAPDPVYGSGADGSATLDGSATVLSMAPLSSVYTATRDLFFYNLIIADNVRLNPAGYRIFVQNVLTLGNGSIIGHTAGFSTTGSVQQGGAANSGALTHSLGGSSATAGVTAPTAGTGGTDYYKQPFQAIKGYSITGTSTTVTPLRGGAGGTVGVGGGVVILAARYIGLSSGTATATIKAPGTAGAGGGGGGVVIIISSAGVLTSGVSTDVTGGTSCSAGTVIYSQVV